MIYVTLGILFLVCSLAAMLPWPLGITGAALIVWGFMYAGQTPKAKDWSIDTRTLRRECHRVS